MLERIEQHLRDFGGIRPLNVNVFTQQDRARGDREYFEADDAETADDEPQFLLPVGPFPVEAEESTDRSRTDG